MDEYYARVFTRMELDYAYDLIDRLTALAYCWTCGELFGLGDHVACRGATNIN